MSEDLDKMVISASNDLQYIEDFVSLNNENENQIT